MDILNQIKSSIIHPRYLANKEIRSYISLESSNLVGKILDIGCGVKPYQGLFKNYISYIGIDLPTTIHNISHIDTYASALALPFRDSSFDSILCAEVLEHVPNPSNVLHEIYRVTKHGGYLLLTAPFSEQLHEEPYDFFRFTEHGLRHLFTSTNWVIKRLHNRGGAWLELGYRFSSLLYSAIGAKRDSSGYLHPRPIIVIPIIFLCFLVQLISLILDKIWKIKFSTIGYVILAQKCTKDK
jgi:SAM-dependent methyltransferase